MERDIKQLIGEMTLEEKAGLCSGLDFWHTKGIERLGIPSVMVTDGPHGLRKQAEGAGDHVGLNASVPATCFPTAAGLAASWNRDLLERVGAALGRECQAEGVAVLLGPGANIKRSPLCGRNFEYFSEDPYLSSEMAAHHILGVQSQGVGTSLKHFAVNNQEHRRMTTDAVVDERTLREIYLASFEGAVKKAQPWTVMCAYNKVNGEFVSEHPDLLTDILKDEWGHEGFVVSDWGAVNERVEGLRAGLELEMPSSNGAGDRKIVEAVKCGKLDERVLDAAVERLLNVIFKAVDQRKPNAVYDVEDHHQLAREAARECMVLLKNEDGILPLQRNGRIAVIGELARRARYQGSGSSRINPTKLDNIYDEIVRSAGDSAVVRYSQGYELDRDETNETMLAAAAEEARSADVAVIIAGLPDRYESEGYDRTHMRLPDNQVQMIQAIAAAQPNVVVVLSNGSPVEMPWLGDVKGLLEAYLGGQAQGGAMADLLFGDANPSGKLAETFPVRLEHNPSHFNFPGEGDEVVYREGIFVGYRYYDTKRIAPLFPFGYGLSYTTFEYSDLQLDKRQMNDHETLSVTVNVKNTGDRPGQEIVQLYVRDVASSVVRPAKELKGFAKASLEPGEQQTVSFTLDKRAFAYYHVGLADWVVETGEFHILIGKSSAEIVLQDSVTVMSTAVMPKPIYHRNSMVGDLIRDPVAGPVVREMLKHMPFGQTDVSEGEMTDMFEAIVRYLPLRGLVNFSGGSFSEEDLGKVLARLNEDQT